MEFISETTSFDWYNHFYQIHKIDLMFSIGVGIFITPYFYIFDELPTLYL